MAPRELAQWGHRPLQLVFPGPLYEALHAHLFPGDADEHGAVIAAGISDPGDGPVRLLARDLILARDGIDYVAGTRGYRKLRAEFIREQIRYCREQRLVYLAIHNHGGTDHVEFSGPDLASHERGYPALLDLAEGLPVGALVLAANAIAADVWLPGGRRLELQNAVILGRGRRVLHAARIPDAATRDPLYDRQARLFGDRGQAVLGALRVGIIGLGGVGSLIAEYLGHLGVGRFVLIDPDQVEVSNLSRLVGATRRDALAGLQHVPKWLQHLARRFASFKVDVAARVIRRANPQALVDAIRGDVLHPDHAATLLGCDYLFLAADSMAARLLFNAIVQQHYIPGVQVGSKVPVDAGTGQVGSPFSIVRPVRPGHGCLWCNQVINPAKLQDEAVSAQERIGQRYLDTDDAPAPSVITLNAVGAAHAVNDFLFFATDLADSVGSDAYLRHFANSRQTTLIVPRRDDACPECGQHSASRLGRGTARRLPTAG